MQPGQQVNLEPQQVQQAAAAGLQLLNTPGAVSVPGPMALTNNVQILNAVLTAIANGQLVLVNAPTKPDAEAGDAGDAGAGDGSEASNED